MKNFVQPGDTIALTAPYDVTSGKGFQVGGIFAVASFDALSGAGVEGQRTGVFDLAKVSAQAWAVGEAIYWDNTNKVATNVKGTANLFIGYAVATAANPSSAGRLVLQPSESKRIVFGQHATVAASDTVATGLATLTGVVATFDDDPGDDPMLVSASIGDQAGAPAAGSFLLKTWKNTGGTDPTPAAATTFAKKVNWIAFGS